MGIYLKDEQNENNKIKCDWWNWRATVEILKIIENTEPKYGWDMFSEGIGSLNKEQSNTIVKYFENNLFPKMNANSRVKLNGSITDEPDDGTFYRTATDLDKNYSAKYEWLNSFIEFVKSCENGLYASP